MFKVAVAPGGRAAAVEGMPGVFVATGLDGGAALAPADPAWADGRGVQLHHDIRWNGDGTVMFAAGKNKTLDMPGVVNSAATAAGEGGTDLHRVLTCGVSHTQLI